MLDDYSKGKGGEQITAWDLLAGRVSLKKHSKEQGKKTAEIHEQYRKVMSMMERASKEWLRRTNPKMTNAECRDWFSKFKQGIEEFSKEIVRQISARETPQIPATKPFSRLGSTHRAPSP